MCDDDGEGAKKALDEMRTPIRSSGKLHLHFNKFCDWRKKMLENVCELWERSGSENFI
jgi:hypothetical protein